MAIEKESNVCNTSYGQVWYYFRQDDILSDVPPIEVASGQEWSYCKSAWHLVSLWIRLTCSQIYPLVEASHGQMSYSFGQTDLWSDYPQVDILCPKCGMKLKGIMGTKVFLIWCSAIGEVSHTLQCRWDVLSGICFYIDISSWKLKSKVMCAFRWVFLFLLICNWGGRLDLNASHGCVVRSVRCTPYSHRWGFGSVWHFCHICGSDWPLVRCTPQCRHLVTTSGTTSGEADLWSDVPPSTGI